MTTKARQDFDTILTTANNSSFTNVTLAAQSPAGTVFSILGGTSHFLYLGNVEKFDMAVFDLESVGEFGTLKWDYYDGSAWTEFIPASGRSRVDPNDNEGLQYDFSEDGVEIFPFNLISDWSTVAVGSFTKYWIRVSSPTSVTTVPTVKRIQMRAHAAYSTTQEIFEFLQLGKMLGGTDFTTLTIPSKATVEHYIEEAQSRIDFLTRKSWRPNYVNEEYHEFNLNGFKLDRADPYRMLALGVWNGANWDNKSQGRKSDYFLVTSTGMVQFSRYFLLPARFTSYNAPVWRWGGGEFTMPIKVRYLNGRDMHTDQRENGIVHDSTKKLVGIEILRNADFGTLVVSGTDRVQIGQKVDAWNTEVTEQLENLRAFEVF